MKQERIILIILFLLGFLVYMNTLNHGYVLDDYSVIKENFVVKKGIDGIPTIWKTHYRYGYGYSQANLFRPLTLSLFAIQWEIAPDSSSFAHWFNVLGYAFLGIIIYLFLQRLWGEDRRLLSFITALLFIAHPIHTEVVANIKSIDDILAMSFSLIGLILLLKNVDHKHKISYWLSVFFFALAFLSKESTVTFLAIIPLSLVLFRSFKPLDALKKTVPYLIPLAIYLLLRMQALGSISGTKKIARLDNLLLTAPDFVSRTATAIKIMGLYLWKLFVPTTLMNDYSLKQISIVNFANQYTLISILVYAALIFLIVKTWKKQKIVAFGILFFLISMSLYSNLIITIGTSFGERLLFIPSLGFCILIAYLIILPFKKKANPSSLSKTARLPIALSLIIVGLYSFKTVDRNKAWKDNFTLYSTDVVNCDKSARCHYYYGLELMKSKALKTNDPAAKKNFLIQAINAFNQSIQILPTYSDAWGQVGLAYFRLNNYEKAEQAYTKAIGFNANNAPVLSNLGSLYFQQQRYQQAKTAYEKALRANPNYLDAITNYASTLGTLGDFNMAITYFKKAIKIQPNNPNHYQMVGITYQNLGNQQQANIYLNKAKQLR